MFAAVLTDRYIQMLEMRLDDLWQLCLSQLKLIAAARTEKRLRIINSFAAFAGVGSGASAQKKPPTVAMKSILKANLIQACFERVGLPKDRACL